MREFILILNFHSVNSKMIAKMLRNNQIFAVVKKGNISVDSMDIQACKGIIISGDNVGSVSGIQTDPRWLKLGIPVLALGSSATALNMMYGGKTSENIVVNASEKIQYFGEEHHCLQKQEQAMVCAKELIPGDNMRCFACVNDDICIDICHKELKIFGIQRILERNDPESIDLIQSFATDICKISYDWDLKVYLDNLIQEIRDNYSDYNVISAVSGGVDSAVATLIFKLALGKQVNCILVDTGFFRKNEIEEIQTFYNEIIKLPIKVVYAKDRFLSAIEDVQENSSKKGIIEKTLASTLKSEFETNDKKTILVSGVNYNDLLFTSVDNKNLETIQSMEIEHFYPLENIFKFEIRKLAEMLMLPDEIVYKQPFSSSGLADKIIGVVTHENLQLLKNIDYEFCKEIFDNRVDKKLWQFYAMISPYPGFKNKYTVYLRAVQNTQNQIAYAYRMPYDLLERVTSNLRYNFPQIRHVMYDITPSESFNVLE